MHVISIDGSKTQKSKLRNGHKVRIKHGAGFNVIVSPNTYHVVSRAFNKNKGVSLQLSPEELAMNKSPSPEMQQTIMGHKEHMVLPNVIDHINKEGRGLGTGIKDFFENIGNKIKGGFEQNIINPAKDLVNKYIPQDIQQDIGKVGKAMSPVDLMDRLRKGEKIQNIIKDKYNTANDVYKRRVPDEIRRDINTAARYSTPAGLAIDMAQRIKKGEKIDDMVKGQYEDLKHLNDTKNKIIKSNPVLTEAYKKGVMATAGLGSAAVGSAFGLSPMTGALAGAAAAKGAEQLLKAEGYGLHHLIDFGMHKYNRHKKHRNPITGGTLGRGHISDFFKNAGSKVKNLFKSVASTAGHYAEKGKNQLSNLHEFILKNPELGAKIKEHGSKLAGLLAKEGIKYATGNEEIANVAGDLTGEFSKEGFKHAGYGEKPKPNPTPTPIYKPSPQKNGQGLYAGRQGGSILEPHSRLVGGGFNSYESLHNAAMGYSDSNKRLANMQDRTVMGQHESEPIRSYYDGDGEPPSRGSGLHKNHHGKVHHERKTGFERNNHYNLVRGRGSLIEHSHLPPALQSQPYGANFHMQNMLPPQYHKYNDGTNEY